MVEKRTSNLIEISQSDTFHKPSKTSSPDQTFGLIFKMNDPRILAVLSTLVSTFHLLGIFVSSSWTISTNSQGVTVNFPWTNSANIVDVNSTSTAHTKNKKKKSPSRIKKDVVRLISHLKKKIAVPVSAASTLSKDVSTSLDTCDKSTNTDSISDKVSSSLPETVNCQVCSTVVSTISSIPGHNISGCQFKGTSMKDIRTKHDSSESVSSPTTYEIPQTANSSLGYSNPARAPLHGSQPALSRYMSSAHVKSFEKRKHLQTCLQPPQHHLLTKCECDFDCEFKDIDSFHKCNDTCRVYSDKTNELMKKRLTYS